MSNHNMRAIVIREPGGPEVLTVQTVPRPVPTAEQLLVRVSACGVNRADLLQRRGMYPAPPGVPADIPGLELAGVVEDTGADVTFFRPEERVMGIVSGGGYAEYVCVHEREVMHVPKGMPLHKAATIPEAFLTAYDALFTQLAVQSSQTLLIHAVGSGVGTAAVQLACAHHIHSLGTSRTPDKLARAKELGLEMGLITSDDWPDRVLEETQGRGVDAVLDLVGGAYLAKNLKVMATRGRLVVVGLLSGSKTQIDLGVVLSKRLTLVGTALRTRSHEEKADLVRKADTHMVPLFESGILRPVLDRTFSAEDPAQAHVYLEKNLSFGKVVLMWD